MPCFPITFCSTATLPTQFLHKFLQWLTAAPSQSPSKFAGSAYPAPDRETASKVAVPFVVGYSYTGEVLEEGTLEEGVRFLPGSEDSPEQPAMARGARDYQHAELSIMSCEQLAQTCSRLQSRAQMMDTLLAELHNEKAKLQRHQTMLSERIVRVEGLGDSEATLLQVDRLGISWVSAAAVVDVGACLASSTSADSAQSPRRSQLWDDAAATAEAKSSFFGAASSVRRRFAALQNCFRVLINASSILTLTVLPRFLVTCRALLDHFPNIFIVVLIIDVGMAVAASRGSAAVNLSPVPDAAAMTSAARYVPLEAAQPWPQNVKEPFTRKRLPTRKMPSLKASDAPDVVELKFTTIQEFKSQEMDPSQAELDLWRASPSTALEAAIAWCGMSDITLATIKLVLGDFQLVRELVLMPSHVCENALTLAVVMGRSEVLDPDGAVTVAAIAPRHLNALELGQVGSLIRCCRLLMELPAEEAQAGPITQASNNQGTSHPAAASSLPLASSPSRKVKMSTCIDQADDTEVFATNSAEARTIIETFAAQNDGIAPDSDEECDATQLQALKTKLDMDTVPYTDFAVWRHYGIRMARMMKFRAQVWKPESAQFIDAEMLTKYAENIDDLVSKYSSLPRGGWWLVALADQRMRSERMERLRRKLEKSIAGNEANNNFSGVCSQTGIKFDKLKPWDAVFLYASQDRDFWDSEVKEKALLYAAKIKDMPDLTDEGRHTAGDEGETWGKKRQRTKKGQEEKTSQRVKQGKGGKGNAGENWRNEETPANLAAPAALIRASYAKPRTTGGLPAGPEEAKEEMAIERPRPKCVEAKRERYLRTKLTLRGPDKRRRGNKDVARVAVKLLQTGKPWDLKIGGAALKSKNFPLGLPYLAAHDKEKVETSNLIARRTASWCKEKKEAHFMRGGDRNKFTKFRVFKCAEAEKTRGKVCREKGGVRDKSGVPRLSFRLEVSPYGSVTFKTAGEAEYPQGMWGAIAEVVKALLDTLSEEGEKAGLEYSFSEIFAGPKAPATTAVESLEGSRPTDLPALVEEEMEDAPTATTGNGEPCTAEENLRIPGAAALLGRAGHSLFECNELRIEVYVDDPLIASRGAEREATRKWLTLLLFWAAFGPDSPWNKASFGRSATWIGAKFDVPDGEDFSVEIPEKYAREMREEAEDLSSTRAADFNRMQKFVENGLWASGLVPIRRTMLSPLWAAMKDVNNSEVIDGGYEWKNRVRKENESACAASAADDDAAGAATAAMDASPWGVGAWLAVGGAPSTGLASAWTDEDAARLGARIGNCEGQNAWEALGI
ncbi:unnamed protein product [Polarella glacialis]|uniref:Uncharacterized protein n=1 Tax=Polarella glacialis TaxID=89957 RepID=A0A813L1G2_POLGL|nr:unnamed protein product [Polarella glacialis]